MGIRSLKKPTDYEAALQRASELMDAQADTPEGDELNVLAALIEHYEARHHPIGNKTALDLVAPAQSVDRIREAAIRLMQGDTAAAEQWLASPAIALGGHTPLEHAQIAGDGTQEVLDLISRIQHGVFS